MNWLYNFLKPTRGKVLLAALIMVLNIALAWHSISAICSGPEICPEPTYFQKITAFTTYPIGIVFYTAEVFEEVSFLPESLLEILYPVTWIALLGLFWYLLACIVMGVKSLTTRKSSII
jgi:hypothetical protein